MAQETISLEDRVNGVLVSSDLHGNYDLISSGLRYANDNNLMYVANGDVVNDYQFSEYAHNTLGLANPRQIQLEYFSQNLSEQDLQTLMIAQTASQYGVENLLDQVSEAERQGLEELLNYSKSDSFQKKIQKVSEDMVNEKGSELQDAQLSLRAFYDVLMDEEAQRFAKELNKYSDVGIGFVGGNHENALFVEQVKQYLDNPNQIVDLVEHDGLYKVETNNGQGITMAGISNCPQFMPYLHEIFPQEELMQLYSHTFKEKSTDINDSLDILLTHGQIGTPVGIENAYDVPYLESAEKLSLEARLTIEGHIHNQYDGKNSLGQDMIRAAGEKAAVISKDDSGNLITDWVRLGDNYNGGSKTPIPYERDYMLTRIEEVKEHYMQLMRQQQVNAA